MKKNNYIFAFALSLLILMTVIIYYQSLDSGFFLDDYPNLGSLPQVKEHGYLSYIFGGVSSGLGRPLSLVTFALQFESWPDNPFAFKLVNLIIHLVNGILIYFLCRLLVSRIRFGKGIKKMQVFCLLTTALWLLHPVHQTTLLYSVQRMTELSTLFTLTGIIFYLYVRKQLITSKPGLSYLLSGITLIMIMVTAILCKENGILLPLYILVIEFTLLGSEYRSWKWKKWASGFLLSPLILLVIYLLYGLNDELTSYHFREYSSGERLLTQSIVVLVYLKNLLVPHLYAFTLFNDDFPISTGIISTPYTLPSTILIGVILMFAFIKRKSYPVLSFGILWFFGGHVLESSYLNLEIYFDHRNYLPSFGIFFLVNWIIFGLYEKSRFLILTGGGLYYCFVLFISITSVSLWATPVEQMRMIVYKHPHSVRANTYLLNSYIKSRYLDNARQEIQNISYRFPGEIFPYLKDLSISACLEGKSISEKKWELLLEMAKTVEKSRFDNISVLNNLSFLVVNGYCEVIDKTLFINLITNLMENTEIELHRGQLYQILATLYLDLGNKKEFARMIIKSSDYSDSIPSKISHIQMLLRLEEYDIAMELLNALKNNIKNNKRLVFAYNKKLSDLENDILSAQ